MMGQQTETKIIISKTKNEYFTQQQQIVIVLCNRYVILVQFTLIWCNFGFGYGGLLNILRKK